MGDLTIISYIVIPVCSILVIPLIRGFFTNLEARIKTLEEKMQSRPTETEVKDLIVDRMEPMKVTLDDIKDRIDKLTDYLIKK